MNYSKITQQLIQKLGETIGSDYVITGEKRVETYLFDENENS